MLKQWSKTVDTVTLWRSSRINEPEKVSFGLSFELRG